MARSKSKPSNRKSAKPSALPADRLPALTGRDAKGNLRRDGFAVVGIGASAGGLEAMTNLLRNLPESTGMAFILVQHLDPTHESALASLLSRATTMPVSEARHNVPLEPNHVYVIPPNRLMDIADRKLKLSPRRSDQVHTPIDYFLRSLALAEGSSAIGVILSGNGSDGTVGLQEIKAAGGITFAQDEQSAKFPTMPGNATASRCVDFVISPARIARELTRLGGHPYVSPDQQGDHERTAPTEEKSFENILATLRQRTGVDFTYYKRATLERRIQRRMVLHKFEKQKDYANHVRTHAAETKELFNDILIHVTGFFRDSALFAALKKKVFPRILKKKRGEEPVRIWVPGCSTGEEVYSMAITLMETILDRQTHPAIQIFGTDINDISLERARAGFYPASIEESVSQEHLRRFFVRQDSGYRVNKALREMCIFARQNLVIDPPFSNLDLISCRNVMIYLGQPLQRKIMPIFHYALKPDGLLVLGASETIGSYAELFHLIDAKAKIYMKRVTPARPPVSFGHFQLPATMPEGAPPKPLELPPNISDVLKQAERILLATFSPAGVIINEQMEVLQFRGRTAPYLEHAQGEASLNLLKLAREGLSVDLRATVSKAMKQNIRVRHDGVRMKQNGHFIDTSVEVVPFHVPPSRNRYSLVTFECCPPPLPRKGGRKDRGRKAGSRALIEATAVSRLREELASTRDSLQAIIEEQEATNEELRSANEEIMSSNEELQSTNEELETAKEELQSTNEELTTLNEELENRNNEMDGVNNDLLNVLGSVNIPMLILGRDLRIRRFTAVAEKLFNLIPADVGRPVTDIALKVEIPDLSKLVAEVIDTLATREVEAKDKENRWWSVQIRPYKTTDNRIDGAVVALVDITSMKNEADHKSARVITEAVINTVREPVVLLDHNLTVRHANGAFLQAFRLKARETINKRIYDLDHGRWNVPRLRQLLEDILPNNADLRDFSMTHEFPRLGRRKIGLNAHRIVYGSRATGFLLCFEPVAPRGKRV